MNKAQAKKIQKHLLDASSAMNLAGAAISALDEERERRALADPLGDICMALHFELLPAVYDQYPELKPQGEIPEVDSALRWDEVVIPSSVSEVDVDAIILSSLGHQWRKTARILGDATIRAKELALPISTEMFSARLCALVEAARIDGKGDLRKWRYSEVRLKG
jgi:hypothetical protein